LKQLITTREVDKSFILSFVVCSNGYGHISRVISVIKEIRKVNKFLIIYIFCSEGTKSFAINNLLDYNMAKQLNFKTDYSHYEPVWTSKNVSLEMYIDFRSILAQDIILRKSKLIISDNLVIPVGLFDHVILMGSFLWMDIFCKNGVEASRVAEYEKELLNRYPIEMLCVKDIVMNSVRKFTKPILLPWFVEKNENTYSRTSTLKKKTAILLTGGGTGMFQDKMYQIFQFLQKHVNEQALFLDGNLFNKKEFKGKLNNFSFSSEDFSILNAVICRPGIGIISACIQNNVPLLAIDDLTNDEISHNSNIVEYIGLGKRILFSDNSLDETLNEIKSTLQDDLFLNSCRKKMQFLKLGGSSHAAEHILQNIYQQAFF